MTSEQMIGEKALTAIAPLCMNTTRQGYLEFGLITPGRSKPTFAAIIAPFIWTLLLGPVVVLMAIRVFDSGGSAMDAVVLGILTFFAVGKPIQALIERFRASKSRSQVRMRLSQPACRIYIDGTNHVFDFHDIENVIIRRKPNGRLRLILQSQSSFLAVEEAWGEDEETALRQHADAILKMIGSQLLEDEEKA